MGASVRVLHVSEDALRLFMSLTRELLKARAERELGQDEEAARAEAIDDCWDDLTPEEVGRAEDFVRILKALRKDSESPTRSVRMRVFLRCRSMGMSSSLRSAS